MTMPEQAGADATRLIITVNNDGSTSFHSSIPPGQSWQATHAAMAVGLREFQRQFDESDKCPVKALSAAPTPPDAGSGSNGAGERV